MSKIHFTTRENSVQTALVHFANPLAKTTNEAKLEYKTTLLAKSAIGATSWGVSHE